MRTKKKTLQSWYPMVCAKIKIKKKTISKQTFVVPFVIDNRSTTGRPLRNNTQKTDGKKLAHELRWGGKR